jgi:hypothetical protein
MTGGASEQSGQSSNLYLRAVEATNMAQYADLLTDPRSFFGRRSDDPSALYPVLIVLLMGALSAVAFWFSWQLVSEFMASAASGAGGDPEVQGMMSTVRTVGAAFGIAVAVVQAFVAWLYYGLLFFGISALMDGEGDFKTTMLFTAWGFVPKLAELVVKVVGNYYISATVTVPETIDPENAQAAQDLVAGNPVAIILPLVGIVALLGCAYIWVGALQESRRLDRGEAIITVAIPVGLILLTRLWNLVNAVGVM